MSCNTLAITSIKPLWPGVLLLSVLIGCSNNSDQSPRISGRWYTEMQALEGKELYETNCIACHGVKGRGSVRDWQQPLKDGSYPPPPLNGSAHSWHHPKKALVHTIKNGGLALGGKMPGFKDELNNEQVDALIAYMQSLWPEDIYRNWESLNR